MPGVKLIVAAAMCVVALDTTWAVTYIKPIAGETVVIDEPGEYALKGDVDARGTGIEINADNVTLDGKGYTVKYGSDLDWRPESTPWPYMNHAFGITKRGWGPGGLVIKNIKIVEAVPRTETQPNGEGHNPILFAGANGAVLENITAEYSGADITGFLIQRCENVKVLNCTIIDKGTKVTNRHQGLDAIKLGKNSLVKGCTIIGARHRGITAADGCTIEDNSIDVDSWAVNGCAVLIYRGKDILVSDNTITGTGCYCIGVSVVSAPTSNILVQNNSITLTGDGLYDRGDVTDDRGPYNMLAGLRVTHYIDPKEADEEIKDVIFDGNKVDVSVTGQPHSKRGVMCVMAGSSKGTRDCIFRNNEFRITSNAARASKAWAVAIHGWSDNSPEDVLPLYFENNVIKGNAGLVRFGEPYSIGCNANFKNCTFIKEASPYFKTIVAGYWDKPTTLHVFEDCTVKGGADLEDVEWRGTGPASFTIKARGKADKLISRPGS